ncbi:hypothetical protein [Acidovorax sp. Root217]|uniref:hypothetical protein n=1 Tax=Acidovorax sp. Root217 TaxID=1736492 RepID=UPI00070A6C90|nr:hypothetical protein [Acidovorax sp. Root217]KRC30688.1 hypothetical protein ASE31_00450 [Acidovorax sp. Root217]
MNILIPIEITDAMIKAGTSIAEPDTGETAWVASAAYVLGDERLSEHAIYECVKAHNGSAVLPRLDAKNWLRKRSSNRYAPFDYYLSTRGQGTGSVTYVLQPGFYRAVDVRGIVGDRIKITAKDAPGGVVIKELDTDLFDQALGLFELLFMPLTKRSDASLRDIPISPTGELTVTVSGGPAAIVGIGKLSVGIWQSLIGADKFGGVESGPRARPKSYTYRKFNDDGTFERVQRGSATNVDFTVILESSEALAASAILMQILDTPVVVEASKLPKFGWLNTVGIVTGDLQATNHALTRASISVEGFI